MRMNGLAICALLTLPLCSNAEVMHYVTTDQFTDKQTDHGFASNYRADIKKADSIGVRCNESGLTLVFASTDYITSQFSPVQVLIRIDDNPIIELQDAITFKGTTSSGFARYDQNSAQIDEFLNQVPFARKIRVRLESSSTRKDMVFTDFMAHRVINYVADKCGIETTKDLPDTITEGEFTIVPSMKIMYSTKSPLQMGAFIDENNEPRIWLREPAIIDGNEISFSGATERTYSGAVNEFVMDPDRKYLRESFNSVLSKLKRGNTLVVNKTDLSLNGFSKAYQMISSD